MMIKVPTVTNQTEIEKIRHNISPEIGIPVTVVQTSDVKDVEINIIHSGFVKIEKI